jgi:hypothetical protein
MSSVQTLATWAQIAAKIDTFPKLPAGSVDIFLTKSEILAKGGGLVKIEDGYSDNSFVALEHVSQYVVEWRYTFDVSPTSVSLPYQGTGKGVTISSYKRKFINNIDQNEQVSVDYSVASKPDWCTVSGTTISASQNGENARSGSVTWTQAESGKQASCSVSQAAGVVSWRYVLEITAGATLNFAGNTSGSQEVHFNSRKYKQVNGVDTGESAWVSVETGYSSGDNYNSINRDRIGEGILTISVGANGSLSSRSEVDYIRQAESGKEVYYTCNQEAGQEGWNYYFSGSPTSMSFSATGGSQSVNVSSYRRRTINGSEDGHQENVNYTGSSNAWASVSGNTISVGQNDSTNQRALNVTYTQSSSGKTFSISITQAAAVIRYVYSATSLAGTSLMMTPYTDVVIYSEMQYWRYTYVNDVQTESQNVGVSSISISNIQGDTTAFDIATYTSNQVQIALMEAYDGAMCRWTVNVKPSNSSMPNRTINMSVQYMS